MRTLLIILVIFLTPITALSEPSNSVAYLMKEPISLLEWGLYRIEDYLNTSQLTDLDLIYKPKAHVDYNWNKNLIEIKLILHPKYQSLSKVGSKNYCRSALTDLKEIFGYGYDKEVREIFGIKRFFEHKGFSKTNEPKNLTEDIETITQLTVYVYANEKDEPEYNEQSSCTSRMLEEELFFLDNEN